MKQTKLFKTLLLLTVLLLFVSNLQAQEPYAVLSEDNTTLTFYYDDSKESRNGMGVGPFTPSVNSGWYAQRKSITTVVFDDSFADCTSITSTAFWFWGCNNLTTITGIVNLHTQNVTDMYFMFLDCSSLTSLDVTNFNTQKVTNMSCMFSGCSSLTSLDVTNFDTQNVTNMDSMFSQCSNLMRLDLSSFNTQNVTNMGDMFLGCSSLTSLDVTSFNTQHVTQMSYMFCGCSSLTSLDLGNFNTQNVTNMSFMFESCSSLTSLNVTNFDTQKTTSMFSMFYNCNSLTSLDVANFDTKNVANMRDLFYNCNSLTCLDVTGFDTQNVTDMSYMFYNCCSLTTLDVTNFNTQNVIDMGGMFRNCSSLTILDVTGFDTQNVIQMSYMFSNCSSLTSLDVTNFDTRKVTYIMSSMFSGCSNLALVMMGENMSIIGEGTFDNCPKLTDVYCLAVTVPKAYYASYKDYIKDNTTLHVPSESISDYQATAPWSYFKNIVALGELVDSEVYKNVSVLNNVDISYTRTFNNTNWQALYVPFAMSYDDWKNDFDVSEINNFHEYDDNEDGKVDRTVLEILYVKEGSTLPNTPYLIRAKETGTKVISLANTTLYAAEENSIDCSSVRTKYTFTGTYTGVSGEEMYSNGYYALAGGTLSQPSSANVSLGSFRWYLKPESRTGNYAAPRKISVMVIGEADGETTSIAEATMNDRQEEYYNLEGVRINRAEATGIYIVRYADGRMKKVIKK